MLAYSFRYDSTDVEDGLLSTSKARYSNFELLSIIRLSILLRYTAHDLIQFVQNVNADDSYTCPQKPLVRTLKTQSFPK